MMRFRPHLFLLCFVVSLLAGLPLAQAQDVTSIPIVAYLNDPTRNFEVPPEGRTIVGTIVFDPSVMAYWKVEIKGRASRSTVGAALEDRVLANDWLTIDDVRRDTVIEGPLAFIPGYPGLTVGNWRMRFVVVGHDGSFLHVTEYAFDVLFPDVPIVPVEITSPRAGQVIRANAPIRGTVALNQWATSYQIELLGGPFTSWTVVSGPFANDLAQPTRIVNGEIGLLPDIHMLPPGQYRMRVVVKGLDANYLQEPIETSFAVLDPEPSNLPSAVVTSPRVSNGVITIEGDTALVGTVNVPEGSLFYKVELKDNLTASQLPRFTDWTMIGSTHAESVVDGQIERLPGLSLIPVGNYLLRIVIVNPDGTFAGEPYELQLRVRQGDAALDLTNTAAQQASGGTAESPAVITFPRITIRSNGNVQVPRLPRSENIRIVGTVVPPSSAYWKLEIRGGGFDDWTTIGTTRTDSVVNGELAVIPAGALERSSFRLRLVIVDQNSAFVGTPFEVPFNTSD